LKVSENEKHTVLCRIDRQNRIVSLHPGEDSASKALTACKLYNVTRPKEEHQFVVGIHPDWEEEGKVGAIWRLAMASPRQQGQQLEQHLKP
jgi:hypothetical protein